MKLQAKGEHAEQPAICSMGSEQFPFLFNVQPQGADGYEWILKGREMTLVVGNWMDPIQRPSVKVDIRSETLWTHGPDRVVQRISELLMYMGGNVVSVKPSRVDLCCDVLLPLRSWRMGLINHFVTRARDISPRLQSRVLSGFTIGAGKISARLYDKPREIAVKSKKFWMYDQWGIESVADDHRIIRVEFQVRREVLKEMGIDTWQNLLDSLERLWAYCTRKWLRIVDDASLHHTMQTILPWWLTVVGGFAGAQEADPLIRRKSIQQDLQRHVAQVMGGFSSITALLRQGDLIARGDILDIPSHIAMVADLVRRDTVLDEEEFTERVKRKQAKQLRSGADFRDAPGAGPVLAVSSSKAAKRKG